jgi:pimeloyl-[acyl-carrier protein] methyl ester esterase
LIHGWGFSAEVWEGLCPHLLAAGYAVHLVDLPGHGESPAAPIDCPLAAVADAVMTAVPPTAAWVGWSLGGLVGLCAAARWPERVGAVVLVTATPRFVTDADWPHAVAPAVLERFATDLRQDPQGTLERFVALQVRGADDAASARRALLSVLRAAPALGTEALELGLRWLGTADLRADLSRIRCPTSLLVGERDTLVPPAVLADILALRPDWHGLVLPRAGHAPFAVDPRGFASLLLREVERLVA